MLLGLFLAALDLLIIATAVPHIAGDLGNLGQVAWVFTAYLLTFTATMPLYGKLGDLYGRKRLFQLAIAIFMVASALAGASDTMLQLILARALQGIGGGGLMALTGAIIGDVVAPRERGRYAGMTSTVWAAAALLGPALGGLLVDHLSWRWAFYINLPTGLLALALTEAGLPGRQPRVAHDVDYRGAALLVAAVGCLLLVTTWGGVEHAWGSPVIVGLTLAGAVLGVLLVVVERRAPEPLVPTRLLRDPVVGVSSITTFLVGAANFGMAIFVPLFLQVVNGTGATTSGLALAPVSLGIAVASTVVGRRITRTGVYRLYPPVGSALFACGLALLATMDQDTPRAFQFSYTLLTGIGTGMVTPVVLIAVQNAVPHRELGTVTALATFSRSIGQAFGSAILGTVMATRLTHHLTDLVPAATRRGLDPDALRSSPEAIAALAPAVRADVVEAFQRAISETFLLAVPFAVAATVTAVFIRHVALRESIDDEPTRVVG